MTDRSERRFTDSELEAALREVGARLAYPPAADLLPAVRARIERRAATGFWELLWSPRLAFAPALATVALLAAVTLAFQPVAATAAEALGLRGITIFRAPETPPPASGKAILADARLVGSVAEASREAGFAVVVPSALGQPDEVYVRTSRQGAQVFLVYGARSGIAVSPRTGVSVLVTEVRGSVETALLGKVTGPGTRTEELTVNGGRGIWIEGAPHQFFFRAPNGDIVVDALRLAGNVLVWEQGTVLVRIEADIVKGEALRIASSVR